MKSIKTVIISIIFIALSISCSKVEYVSKEMSNVVNSKAVLEDDGTLFAPYRLSTMQSLFDAYCTEQIGANSEESKVALHATHYAVRIKCQNEKANNDIKNDTNVIICPVEFFTAITSDYPVQELLNPNKTQVPAINSVVSHNSVDDEQFSGVCLMSEYKQIELSDIYALWPKDKPFLNNTSVEIMYEAFIPEAYSGQEDNAASISIANWISSTLSENTRETYSGYLYAYDNKLNSNIPVRGAKIMFSSNNRLNYIETDVNGYFVLPGWMNLQEVSLILWLETDDFAVRGEYTSQTVTIALGQFSAIWGNNTSVNIYLPYDFEVMVYQSAWYYFNGSNPLLNAVSLYNSHINIQAVVTNQTYSVGHFYYTTPPYIDIMDYSQYSSEIFGTVLHELGHATQYANDGYSLVNRSDYICESFASFFGWYNVLKYYQSIIPSTNDNIESLTYQGRQGWHSTNNEYTPLYVDLYDSYNQSTTDPDYLDDEIELVPISAILNASLSPRTLSQVSTILNSYIGTYYTQTEYSNYIAGYNGLL